MAYMHMSSTCIKLLETSTYFKHLTVTKTFEGTTANGPVVRYFQASVAALAVWQLEQINEILSGMVFIVNMKDIKTWFKQMEEGERK